MLSKMLSIIDNKVFYEKNIKLNVRQKTFFKTVALFEILYPI